MRQRLRKKPLSSKMTNINRQLKEVRIINRQKVMQRWIKSHPQKLLKRWKNKMLFSRNIRVDGLESDSKYVFQYVRDVEIRNARITTKDAFWEVENVTIYDSRLDGEYLGWHSKNLRLVRCHISGEQPLCYARDLVLEDCTFDPACDRAFEYSTLRADIRGAITNIKNPTSGRITADAIGSVTLDENIKAPADCVITTRRA